MFKQLKSLGRKAMPYLAAITIGLTNIYCGYNNNMENEIHLSQKSIINHPKHPKIDYPKNTNHIPDIDNSPLEVKAGDYLEKKIISDQDNDVVTTSFSGPKWITLENGVLRASPRYSILGPEYSQTGKFKIEISANDGKETVSKNLELTVLENDIPNISYQKTNEDIKFPCKTPCEIPKLKQGEENHQPFCINPNYPSCNIDSYKQAEEIELDSIFTGFSNTIKTIKQRTKFDTPIEKKPVNYSILKDDICSDGIYSVYLNTSDGKSLICDKKAYDINGNLINRVYNINGNLMVLTGDITNIQNYYGAAHEWNHTSLNNQPYYSYVSGKDGGRKIQESLAIAIAAVITKNSGFVPELNSFCGWNTGNLKDINGNPIWLGAPHPLINNLCDSYGIDIDDMPQFFENSKKMATADNCNGNITCINDVIKENVWTAKCIMDDIASRKTNIITNTYPAFAISSLASPNVDTSYCGTFTITEE